jgi:hypothetical protein
LTSYLNKDKLDAEFSGIVQDGREIIHGQEKFTKEDFCSEVHKYKYTIDIDGHIGSWGRIPNMLLSDSVPILIESNYTTIYRDNLVPYYHYVPVKND